MGKLIRPEFIGMLIFSLVSGLAEAKSKELKLKEPRLTQAKELLGSQFKRKVTRNDRGEIEVTDFVMVTTQKFLPKEHKAKAETVAQAILNASEEFGLDPVFLMAVIQNESSFNPKRKGTVGEIGLMQILPKTAAWIAELYGLDYKNANSLYNPEINIWIGAALMNHLRHQFDSKGHLYVSAYNVGPKKLKKMVAQKKQPKIYVNAVMKRYVALYAGFKAKGNLNQLGNQAFANIMDLTN